MSGGATIVAQWRSLIAQLWRIAIGILTWALLIFVAARAATDITYANAPGLIAPLILLFWTPCAAVHELGHATVARLVGWDVHQVMLAGIVYVPARRRFTRLRRSRRRGFGGFVFATPPPGHWSALRAAGFTAGGPLANFLFAGLCVAVASRLAPHGVAAALTGGTAMTSLVIGALNLIPVYGNGRSDGAVLLALAAGQRRSQTQLAADRITGLLSDGVPPAQWDPALLGAVETGIGLDDRQRLPILVSLCLADGDLPRLFALLQEAEKAHPEAIEPYRANYAFAAAIVEHDAEHASAILGRCTETQSLEYWRAMAVIASLKGLGGEAAQSIALFREAARAAGGMPDADDEKVFAAIARGDVRSVDLARA